MICVPPRPPGPRAKKTISNLFDLQDNSDAAIGLEERQTKYAEVDVAIHTINALYVSARQLGPAPADGGQVATARNNVLFKHWLRFSDLIEVGGYLNLPQALFETR